MATATHLLPEQIVRDLGTDAGKVSSVRIVRDQLGGRGGILQITYSNGRTEEWEQIDTFPYYWQFAAVID